MLKLRYFQQSLRGGGSAFSSTSNSQGVPQNIQIEAQLHSTLLNAFLVNLNKRLEQIEHIKEIMSTEEGKSVLNRNIAWFLELEQLFCYFQFQIDLVKRHKQIIEKTLQCFLELASTTIQWDRSIALKVLKICNSFSRLIFIFYSNSNERTQQQQIDRLTQLTVNITNYVNLEGETSLFYNGLIYELTLIQACIKYIPTQEESQQKNDSAIAILKELVNSAVNLKPSPDLASSISKGALFLYQQYQKKKSMEQFQKCLFLEQLKWNILMSIKAGVLFNEIEDKINDNYNKIIKQGSDWAIQYSWIKMASELMACKPQITKVKFLSLQQGSNQAMTWEQAQSDNLINVIHKDFEIAEIIAKNQTSNIGIKLQSISRQYYNLQNFFMNGNQVIPKFIGYYTLESGKDQIKLDNESNQDYFKMIQALRQIPFDKIAYNFNEFLNKFSAYLASFYQIEPKTMDFTDFQYHLILIQEQYQSLLNDVIKFQISRNYINNIIEIISPLLIKSDELNKQQTTIYHNCFQTFLYNYSKIQSKKQFDKKIDIYDKLVNWLKQINIVQEQQINYQKQFGKKLPEDCFALSKIQEKPFQTQLNYLIFALQFCQIWNQQVSLLSSLFTAEHIIINKQVIITKQTQEDEMKSISDNLIEEFINRQNANFEYLHSIYSILQMQYEQFFELKALLFDNFSLEDFEKIQKKQKIEFLIDLKIDFNLYFQYQINQHQQLIQLLDNQNEILSNQMKEYQIRKLNYFCFIFNFSLISINQIFSFNLDSIKKMEMLVEFVSRKDNKILQNFKSNQIKLQTQIDLLIASKDKIQQFSNIEYVEKVKEFEISVQAIQQELLIINNSDYRTQLVNELNKFNEFLVHARTRQKNQLDSTIEALKTCTLEFIDKIENLFKNLKQSWKQELITEMSESIDERKPNQAKLLEFTNNFKNQVLQVQQSIEFSEVDTLQNLVDLMRFTVQNNTIHTQCEDKISKILQKFQLFISNIKSLNYEAFCKSYSEQLYSITQNHKELDRFLKDELNFIFSPVQNQVQTNLKQCKQSITASILEFIQGNSWRVKEGFLFQCIQLENQLQEQNKQSIQKILILIAAKETNLKILVTLKNKQIVQQMYQGFSKNWPEVQSEIQSDLASQISRLEQLQFSISTAETDRKKEQLLKEHKKLEEQVEQQILNVNQIGDALGITINFLREIKQDLNKIQQKLDQMLNKIDEVVQDIKQLIGKTPKQLFEIRMQYILQQKIANDFNNVYVNLRTKELKENFKDEDDETTLFNDVSQNKGEIDEFLQQPKDSLLIHGPAGSGKSVAAIKIEEYIWLQYQQLNLDEWSKDSEQIPVVPIFIQLASLKDPYFKAIEESLASTNYNFDWRQIQAFQTQVEEGKVAIVFILDSFDELSNNQINLIQNNKLKNWRQQLLNLSDLAQGQQRIYSLNYPKVITTTRSEVFELNSTNYRQWFSSESLLDFTKYKELRILSFDDNQKQDYLKQYSYTQIKKTLLDYFEKYSIIQKRGRNLINEVEKIWKNVVDKLERFNHYQQSNDLYLSDKQINIITSILKSEFKLSNKQDQFAILERQLRHIQTPQFYNNNIIDFNLEQLLKTPFMMKIVIDVLPQINSQKQQLQQNYFISNYTHSMYEKYVKKKEIKEIRQFLERISLEQYKEDQADELNNQSQIPEQPEYLEVDEDTNPPSQYYMDERIQQMKKASQNSQDYYQQSNQYYQKQQHSTQNQKSSQSQQQMPKNYSEFQYGYPQTMDIQNSRSPHVNPTNYQEQLKQGSPSTSTPQRPFTATQNFQQIPNQYNYEQAKQQMPLRVEENNERYRQSNYYEQIKQPMPLNVSSQQRVVGTYQVSRSSAANHQMKPLNNSTHDREEVNYQGYESPNNYQGQVEYAKRVAQERSQAYSPNFRTSQADQPPIVYERDQGAENFKLSKDLKIKNNLQIRIKENLREKGKQIFQKNQYFSQQDYDQFGEDKQILLRCYKSFRLTQYDFYEQFLENYIQNQMQRMSNLQQLKFNNNFVNEVNDYSRLLVSYLMQYQLTAMETSKTSNMSGVWNQKIKHHSADPRFQELFNQNSEEITLIKKCLPLKQTGSILSFEHKSIQEFIYAKFIIINLLRISEIINLIKQMKVDVFLMNQSKKLKKIEFISICINLFLNQRLDTLENQEQAREIFMQNFMSIFQFQQQVYFDCYNYIMELISLIDFSPLNYVIMANQFYMGTTRFIVEYIQNNTDLKSVLHILVLISGISLKFVNISSNSFQLLSYMQELFYEKNFSGIYIKDIKLLGLKCIGCDFSRSTFENVTLMGTNLNYCKIAEVKWKDIISQDLPTLSFNIGPILKASFSIDGNYIASLGLNKQLVVYQIGAEQVVQNVELTKEVVDFCWSNTKSMLVYFSEETLNIMSFYQELQNRVNYGQRDQNEQRGQPIKSKLKIGDTVNLVKFSNQDSYLSVGCQKGKIIIYKYANSQFTQFREIIGVGKSRITVFDFSPDEDNLIVCDQTSIFLYKIQEEQTKSIRTLQQNQQVTSIVFSPDGQLCAYATTNELIIIFSLVKQKEQAKLIGHQKAVRCICFSNEGNILVSGGDDKSVRIWDYMKGIQIGENLHSHSDGINSIEFSKPDGMIIMSAGKDGLIKQWHHSDNYRVSEYLPGHDGSILFMIISQDSQRIITKGKDKKIIQWNIKTASMVNQVITLQSCQECSINKLCSACQLSPIIIVDYDQYIITGGFGHSLSIYDSYTGKQTFQTLSCLKPKGEVTHLAYSQKNHFICSGTQNGEIKIWDSLNGRQYSKNITLNHQILALFFDLDQNLVVLNQSGKYTNFKLGSGDTKTQSFQYELMDEASEIKQINQLIVDEIADQQIDTSQNSSQRSNNKVSCLALTSDYSHLAIATKASNVYILETKDLSKIFSTYSYQGVITSMHFNKIDLILILSFEDLSIKVWDISKNMHGNKIDCHQAPINCLGASLDNKFIVSTSLDKCIKIWKLQNLSDDGIFSEDINRLKKKIQSQKQTHKESFQKLNFSPINQISQDIVRLTDNLEWMNLVEERQLRIFDKVEQMYHHLSELRRVDMSATLREQKTLKDEITKEGEEIEQLLYTSDEMIQSFSQNMIDITTKCFTVSQILQERLLLKQNELKIFKETLIKEKEERKQEKQHVSEVKVNSQNQITFSEILCINKTPQNQKFIGTVFEKSNIRNKTNHDLFKLWQQTQEKKNHY
ncbi:unnamed protein product (macronuclear) [Paramecium tetraurelia]|uniref:Uncharacterized protein n=1 Tax=Paramecium tetraurelia TaxID=5888 RepID=A0EEJ9_PARTE|nr:uncharacterized protein GSPATT00026062001 [Paramecium tetraurelia]CAK93732.1 unnamed protein product [Paramecium tetraurelia]|eukprot:XP_001461113.1 hypothetical protein (macronuclear) [Paramecium tetraurelia strain d4-2]